MAGMEHSVINVLPEQSLSSIHMRRAVANILISKCCSKEYLLFLSGHDVLTVAQRTWS